MKESSSTYGSRVPVQDGSRHQDRVKGRGGQTVLHPPTHAHTFHSLELSPGLLVADQGNGVSASPHVFS